MIYIIRHGQTEMNSRHALQGRSDFALNEAGLQQAQKAAERLRDVRFDRVYSSPLRASGFVNLRFAPHAEAEIATICYDGHALTVIAVCAGLAAAQFGQ